MFLLLYVYNDIICNYYKIYAFYGNNRVCSAGLKPGQVIWVIQVTFCLGEVGLIWLIKYQLHDYTKLQCSTCMHTCIYTCIPTYIHTYIRTCIHIFIHTCIRIFIHKYIHTYIHTYTHTYIHTYIIVTRQRGVWLIYARLPRARSARGRVRIYQ